MIFNGIEKDYLTVLRDLNRPAWAPIERELITVPGMSGAHLSHSKRQVRAITVPVFLRDENFSDLQKIKEDLAEWLIHDVAKELKFTDEPDRTYYAFVDGGVDLDEMVKWGEGVITFICPDPYKYGPEESKDVEDNDIIESKGTADADPIIELTTKKKSTFALISLGDDEDSEYNLIGTPTEVDEEVVDAERVIFEERGRTLDSWTSTGTAVDGGDVSGELNTDYDGITVPDYGTGNRWHGPALIKEINAIQDFEVEMMLRAETRYSDQTFRIEMYLFDENMNNLGKMGIWDNDYNGNEKKGEARYGPMGAKFERYLISSRNYKQKVNQYFGLLRWTREGNKMTFYITRINTRNEHVKSIKETVRVDESLMGKLKYIQIHIGKYADRPNANSPRLLSIKTTEFLKYTVDQTPNIVYPGDVITFDHKVDDLLINGEPRNDLKNFGGSFFTLKKGFNNLIVTPSDSFDTKVTYRDKYL